MIVKDIVANARLSEDQDGYTAERIFIVEGVTGSRNVKLFNALSTSGIPAFGAAHPSIPGIQVVDRQATPINSGDQVKIEITYSTPSDDSAAADEQSKGKALITSSLTSEETFFDVKGDLMKVQYSSGGSTITRYGTADVQRPQMRVTLSRKESRLPKQKLQNYLGRINSVEWSGFPAKTWLCSGISVRENDNAFDVEYSFEYREDKWVAEIILGLNELDAELNPVSELSGNAYGRFEVYKTANFNKLGVKF